MKLSAMEFGALYALCDSAADAEEAGDAASAFALYARATESLEAKPALALNPLNPVPAKVDPWPKMGVGATWKNRERSERRGEKQAA